MYVGVDGCPAGWFAVLLADDGDWQVRVFDDIRDLWHECKEAELILIDIPIGLREGGDKERLCDKEARSILTPVKRHSTVFPPPCRPALMARSYSEACSVNRARTGKALSKQCWAIAPKITEVDDLLIETGAQGRIREIHPEICFWGLAGMQPMANPKREKEGMHERLRVLNSLYDRTPEILAEAVTTWRPSAVAPDDVLDASAAALTAYLGYGKLQTLPAEPETDEKGLRMEMVYLAL